jgi:hypothetical protein
VLDASALLLHDRKVHPALAKTAGLAGPPALQVVVARDIMESGGVRDRRTVIGDEERRGKKK